MSQNQTDLLSENLFQINTKRRRSLIPWWIKIFIWIFIIFGTIAPLALIFGILGYNFEISLYGFETKEPVSITGLSLIFIFLFKGFTAYSLWQEKSWAIILGIIDALIGIILCSFIMTYPLIFKDSGVNFIFRLELVLLIPYLLKMITIKPDWKKSRKI